MREKENRLIPKTIIFWRYSMMINVKISNLGYVDL